MAKRKIAECFNVRINVGNYQHIEITKYAEEEIEYSSDTERLEKENQLRDDLCASISRTMKELPSKLGKGVEQAVQIEESIKKAIPEWLEKNPIPNIANGAKKRDIQAGADAKNNITASIDKKNEITMEVKEVEKKVPSKNEAEELFEVDAPKKVVEPKKDDSYDIFGDDDIFGDEK